MTLRLVSESGRSNSVRNARLVSNEQVNPRFSHDCELCVFLGQLDDKDLYRCKYVGYGAPVYYIVRGRLSEDVWLMGSVPPTGSVYAFAHALWESGERAPRAYQTK